MTMPSLLSDYKKFESIMNNYDSSNCIDTSNYPFLAPSTLIPLLCEFKKRECKIITHPNTYDYILRILNEEQTDTTTPYTILPYSEKERQDKELSHKMAQMIDEEYGGFFVLRHILAELTNNIYNHTPFEEELASQGYTYAQEYPNEKKLDICVLDDGLSIPGRFKKSNMNFEDECHAIEKAISNCSTKSEDGIKRGNGLWSTLKLAVEGNGGSALIISGKGCLHIESLTKYKYEFLDNINIFEGTLISLRLNRTRVQNIHNLIEIFENNPYVYPR